MDDTLPPRGVEVLNARGLCRDSQIAEGEAKGFVLGSGTSRRAVFVLRHGGRLLAYVNSCPHQGTPLDLAPHRFFTTTGAHIICRTHGALFRPGDGFCVAGPCVGKSLAPAAIRVRGGIVWLES
jgi:naringenin degradation protein FdeD